MDNCYDASDVALINFSAFDCVKNMRLGGAEFVTISFNFSTTFHSYYKVSNDIELKL